MSTAALICALAAAASWAVASISISRVLARGDVSPAAANLFKNGVAASCFLVLALAGNGRWPVGDAWVWLFGSGLLGFAISDTLYFAAFRRCGVQTAATVMLLNVPIATLLAVPLAGDAIDGRLVGFMALVLGGVLLVTLDRKGADDAGGPAHSRRTAAIGILFAVAAATAIGTAVPLGRGRFEDVDVFTGGCVRLMGGAFGAIPIALLSGVGPGTSPRRELRRLVEPLLVAPGPSSVWGKASLIGVASAVLGLLPYHYALRELPGGLAAVLFSSTPLFTLPLCLLIGQRVGLFSVLGTGLGFAGVAAILLGSGTPDEPQPVGLLVEPVPFASPVSARYPVFVEGERFATGALAGTPGGLESGPAARSLPPAVMTARAASGGDGNGVFRLVLLGDSDPSSSSERTVTMESGSGAAPLRRYFVNWADVPRAARLSSGALLAATLERLGDSTYAYGVRLTLEEDGPPGRDLGWLHDDEQPVEHGFVSLLPLPTGGALGVWLDDRAGGTGVGHGSGAGMQLLGRTIDAGGTRSPEVLLDRRVCDCCPTDAVALPDGSAVVVYRDRSEDETRDIWTVRRAADGEWSEPRPVYQDGWRTEACPVNGPAIATDGSMVAVAWYTEAGVAGEPRVLVAFSRDAGATYSRPIEVDSEGPLGRVDIGAVGGGAFVVTYLGAPVGGKAPWTARAVTPGRAPGTGVLIAQVDAARRSGRLSLAASPGGVLHAIWTVQDGVEAARLRVVTQAPATDAGPNPQR
ncbi:MAG: EamA family transporter [Planctomycetota bacterium]|nr:EamA family transporter [Planctomycetota bacterium]